jgi:hypothetical protein
LRKSQILVLSFYVCVLFSCENKLQDLDKQVAVNQMQQQSANNYPLSLSAGDIRVEKGRLVFANPEVYIRTLNAVGNMNKPQMDAWETSLNFTSLRTYNLKHIKDPRFNELELSPSKAMLLNPDGEYQIGNIIYWLNDDSKIYVIPNADEKLLKKVQQNPAKSGVRTLKYATKNIPIKGINNGEISINTITIGGNYADARYQYQYQAGGHTYKMVFQVRAQTEGYILATGQEQTTNSIYAEIILEYLQSSFWGNRWVRAGETAVKSMQNGNYYSQNRLLPRTCLFRRI